jgi:L-fuculose-phosphate aldolase
MAGEEREIKNRVIKVGVRLYQAGLALGRSGNISARLNDAHILITATGTFLGNLTYKDIVRVGLRTHAVTGHQKPSSESPLHALIYKNFPVKTIIHCHPPLTNGYFAVASRLKALTFEAKCYLGNVPVVKQYTPTVMNPGPVLAALKKNKIVVLKNHGVVSIADNFQDALGRIETLEEAIKVAAIARLCGKGRLDDIDKALKRNLRSPSFI